MYFHLIWIKEKNWEKYDLDLLLSWWDEDFIRKFLWIRWVVIVSIGEFKENPNTFWNINISVVFDDTEIQILTQWDNLDERLYFIIFLWLAPVKANYVNNPISEDEVQKLIESNTLKIKEEDEKVKEQKELAELKEQKKYEESWIKDGLNVINANIDRIEQIMKAWEWLLSWSEIKKLDDYLNEMKKIRLWTNFNKMAALVLDAHILVRDAEEKIIEAYNSKNFLIDQNSSITNIDMLSEYFNYNRISEKAVLQPAWLTTKESMSSVMKTNSIFVNLLWRDISYTFKNTSLDELIDITIHLVEYMTLTAIVVVSTLWLFGQLLWYDKFSLYLLPAMWWLWLLLYLYWGLKIKWVFVKFICFVVLVYSYWFSLLSCWHILGTYQSLCSGSHV